ncbi:MAG: isoaspartyl peptidase/L-asparaginase [Gammaproteobacteria bacterium]
MLGVRHSGSRASFIPFGVRAFWKALLSATLALAAGALAPACAADAQPIAIVIHGGAGVVSRAAVTPERETQYRIALETARDAGYAVLEKGGSSLDAVTAAVHTMEDNPLFNAGIGAVLNRDGEVEMDASIMDGSTLRAGAVAGIKHVKNPIELARAVMEKSPHVMIAGEGAEEFALGQGFTLVPNSYFRTEPRMKELERVKQEARTSRKPSASSSYANPHGAGQDTARSVANLLSSGEASLNTQGTVGAVALDRNGNLAAATSTGGMTNKLPGRIGDSPLIGAGTYANNASCAVSATGDGEYFIRAVVAHDVCALVEYKHLTLEAAAREVIHVKIEGMHATGGVIALDTAGNLVMDFNSSGMFRASRDSSGRRNVAIFPNP